MLLEAPRRTPTTALAVVLTCALALPALIRLHGAGHPADFLTYRYGALAAGHGVDAYRGVVSGPGLAGQPFTYTPFAALALWPTTLFGRHLAFLLWRAASLLVLGAVLARFVPPTTRHRPLVVAAALAAAATTCVTMQNIDQGQVNILLMGLCLADAFRRDDTVLGRTLPRGVLVGVATAIKLTPGLFIVFFLISGQWRLARHSLAGAAAATALGVLAYPAMSLTFFRSVLWSMQDRVDLAHPVGYWGNNSVDGAVEALGTWARPLAVPLMLAGAVGGLLAARSAYRAGRDLDAWLVVGLTASLASPFTWTHHVVYLLPALTRIALHRSWARSAPMAAVGGALLVLLHYGPALGETWLHTSAWLAGPGVLMRESLVLLSAACIVVLARGRRDASGAAVPAEPTARPPVPVLRG